MKTAIVEDLRKQLADLTARVAELEEEERSELSASVVPEQRPPEHPQPSHELTEEELLAISAAIAAYLGVRPHIRQIRLISSNAWAQQGRVSIQASHRLHS